MRRWAILLTVLVLAGCHKKAADVGDAAAHGGCHLVAVSVLMEP